MPEVRRLLLAITESPAHFRLRLAWSTFRRRHQAVAQACHRRRRAQQQAPPLAAPAVHRLAALDLALTDERWARIAALLPPQKPATGRPNADHRAILEGILWVIRTGASWRDLPEEFGPWETVHGRYQRWCRAGLWPQIYQVFTQQSATHDS